MSKDIPVFFLLSPESKLPNQKNHSNAQQDHQKFDTIIVQEVPEPAQNPGEGPGKGV